jgi:hypothetical protein
MTAREMISNFRAQSGPSPDPRELFLYLANNAYDVRLADGGRILDLTDFTTLCIELAQALKPETSVNSHDKTCPRCGHIHEGDRECGFLIGGGRICRCEMEVPA